MLLYSGVTRVIQALPRYIAERFGIYVKQDESLVGRDIESLGW